MAVTKLSNSGIKTGVLKYDSMLAGNAAYDPAATWLIQRVNGTGSNTSIDFSSIPSNYASLQLRIIVRDTVAGTSAYNLSGWINNDTAANYAIHSLYGDGSSVLASGNASGGSAYGFRMGTINVQSGNAAGICGVAIVDFHNYTNTSQNKTVRSFSGYDNNGGGYIGMQSTLWLNTSAINRLTINASTAFSTSTTIALYGIKGA